jgi:hypothetical protein
VTGIVASPGSGCVTGTVTVLTVLTRLLTSVGTPRVVPLSSRARCLAGELTREPLVTRRNTPLHMSCLFVV